MPNYDFHNLLEPMEFQNLVCDIVQQRDNIILETFKEGSDSGIDGLYTYKTKKIIVQAKRYQQDFKKLYQKLKYVELPKVKKLNPDRYILGVSLNFNPKQKEKIVELFEGYIINTSDILSRNDINRFLKDPLYKHIELSYPKLWLPNLNVFEEILKKNVNRAVFKESIEELKEAIRTSKVFVPTRIYRKALNEWSKKNVIVISGEPGVGKTTMAYLLALAYLQPKNLDGFVWANSIEDIYKMWEDNQKQVIILDDFWGSILNNDYSRKNDEKRLDKLIKRILDLNGEKRLILTTREYILQQGLYNHPALKETLERYALICTMEEYGGDEKASILFRHLYASNLNYEYVNYLYNKCEMIINHWNYNPRVLAIFLARGYDKKYSPQEYFEELCEYFDNPGEFWRSIFIELSEEAQIVVMLLLISSTPMRLFDMNYCYEKYIHLISYNKTKIKNLRDTLIELEKTMIKSFYSEENEEIQLKFIMPAVQDFLFEYIEENCEQYIPLLLQCCSFYNQLLFIFEHLSSKCSNKVLNLIVEQCIQHYQDYCDSYLDYDGSWNWDYDFLSLDGKGCLDRFFKLICNCDPIKHPTLFSFLEKQINNYCLTMGKGDLEAQYSDLHNLPDIIVSCVKKGMTFNGEDIIYKYYEAAFSSFHYLAMEKFQEVFPKEYDVFYEKYFMQIKKNLKNIILSELEFLEEYYMEIELDVLIDSIPEILKNFGLRYTKVFGEKVFLICGREPILLNTNDTENTSKFDVKVYQEEKTIEAIVDDAKNWLFGPKEIWLEDEQIVEIISNSNLSLEIKKELIKVIDNNFPYYLYNLLSSQESIKLLLTTLLDTSVLKSESNLYFMILRNICSGNQELLKKLIGFCAECFILFIYQKEPVLRVSDFLSNNTYIHYLKYDEEFKKFVHENLIVQDEQWIRFLHIPIFIFCFVLFLLWLWGRRIENLKIFIRIYGETIFVN